MRQRLLIVFLSLILGFTWIAAVMPLSVFAEESEEGDYEDEEEKKPAASKKSDSRKEINKEIENNKNAISEAESEKAQINKNITDVESVINSLESQKGNLEGYVKSLDSSLDALQGEISGLNSQIDDLDNDLNQINSSIDEKKKDIARIQEELSEAKETLSKQYEDTKQHIKYMYATRTMTFAEALFTSTSIQEFLNRAEYVKNLAAYDNTQLKNYEQAKKEVEEKEAQLLSQAEELNTLKDNAEKKKDDIEDQKGVVAKKQEDVTKLISVKEQEIDAYEADITSKEEQIKEYQDMIAAQDAIIRSLEAAIAASQAKLAEEDGEESSVKKYDGGQFSFPAPSYTRISDDYGNRIHPTLGVEQFHNGIDLAAPSGSPILAAYDGTVIAADYSSTMGNYIMIDHGDSLFTIYMHASSLLVSNGANVSKGQKIALVGSTGRSTGPHLHFSVRINGSYVSPWKYLK